jgi:hypothetical protein
LSVPILSWSEAARFLTEMAVRRLGAPAASELPEVQWAAPLAQLSARAVEQEASRVEVAPLAATARPSAASHAVVAAQSAVPELEVLRAARHGAVELRVAQVRRAAGSDGQVQLSAAPSAFPCLHSRPMAPPARTGPARIAPVKASSSARRR